MKIGVYIFFTAYSVYFSLFSLYFVQCKPQLLLLAQIPYVTQIDEVTEKPARQGGLHK